MTYFYPEGLLSETSQNRAALSSAAALEWCVQSRQTVEARVISCDPEHNLIVDLGIMRGFIPRVEAAMGIEEGTTRDIAVISRVNKYVAFKVLGFTERDGQRWAVLSRRQAQSECQREYVSSLSVGAVIHARVTHLEDFGAFVDVGCGVVSLIPIDCISVSRIAHPRDRFEVGQNILAVVKSIDADGRLCLTHKELLGTWQQNADEFSIGETVSGIIRSIEDYGVFVELTPNLAGLAELREGLRIGQTASVYIKNIIPEKMKIKLVILETFDEPSSAPVGKYYYTERRMDKWLYSPPTAQKQIVTVF